MKDRHIQKHFPLRAIFLLIGSILLFLFLAPMRETFQAANSSIPLHNFSNTSIQVTPTVDPTITTLEKENLDHENSWA